MRNQHSVDNGIWKRRNAGVPYEPIASTLDRRLTIVTDAKYLTSHITIQPDGTLTGVWHPISLCQNERGSLFQSKSEFRKFRQEPEGNLAKAFRWAMRGFLDPN
jgi:hypothetical protein